LTRPDGGTDAATRAPDALPRGLAPLAILALVLVVCAPVLGDPAGLALGHPRTDTWNHVWGYDHVARALASGASPLDAALLSWPQGGTLYFIDTFGALLLSPVTLLGGAGLAYNLSIALNLTFAGLAMHALARDLTRDDGAALFAALAYASTPHVLAQAYNGITETLAIGWLPLLWLSLRRVAQGPTLRRGAVAGLVAGCAAAANAYYGLFALGLGAMWLVWLGRAAPRRLWAARGALAVAAACGLVVVTPFALAFRASLDADDAVVAREGAFTWASLTGHNQTDALGFLRPGDHYSPDLRARFDDSLIVVVYAGWTLLLVAGLGVRRDPHRARGWFVAALAAAVLALGPLLYAGGRYVRLGEDWVPLPFLALYDLVPGLSRVSHPFRFAVLVGLCLSMAGALAIASLRAPVRRWAGPALGILVAIEALLASPAVFPLPVSRLAVPAFYAELPPGGVIDLPLTLQVLPRARFVHFQLLHGQGVPWGLNDPVPPVLAANRLTRFLLLQERAGFDALGPELPAFELEIGRRALRDAGYRSLVVHPALYPGARVRVVREVLDATLGPPRVERTRDGDALVYDLEGGA
jgi:hypothetical protein